MRTQRLLSISAAAGLLLGAALPAAAAIPPRPEDLTFAPLSFTPPEAKTFRHTLKDGTVFDESMEDRIRITVVATGLGAPRAARQPVMQIVQGTGTYGPAMGNATGVDMTNLDVPAVMRSGRRTTVEAMSTSGVGTYDIPAFLRRQAD